jgi:hypothetical protein
MFKFAVPRQSFANKYCVNKSLFLPTFKTITFNNYIQTSAKKINPQKLFYIASIKDNEVKFHVKDRKRLTAKPMLMSIKLPLSATVQDLVNQMSQIELIDKVTTIKEENLHAIIKTNNVHNSKKAESSTSIFDWIITTIIFILGSCVAVFILTLIIMLFLSVMIFTMGIFF